MTDCATYWNALNAAEEKLVALESMLAEGKASLSEIREKQEAFPACYNFSGQCSAG